MGGLLEGEVPHQFGIHGLLEERQYVMTQIRGEVSARTSRPGEAAAVSGRPGLPVLGIWPVSLGRDGAPYELTGFVVQGDMTGLRYYVTVA